MEKYGRTCPLIHAIEDCRTFADEVNKLIDAWIEYREASRCAMLAEDAEVRELCSEREEVWSKAVMETKRTMMEYFEKCVAKLRDIHVP